MSVTEAMSEGSDKDKDGHEHDLVMPGFRFHPTEEELIEFYLRRKVHGKHFNIELITFLDLYSYDPWELPALAAIGEKEWFFYVPRDRKYRNGDRPNRVTTSGYWKATGADRMIRGENSRPIGLKKTLVFYTGKAPKGIRTSWIMNEYRLPQSETDRHQKEISLCRVYKRSGIDDYSNLLSSKPSSTRGAWSERKHNMGHQPSTSSSSRTKRVAEDSPSAEMDKIQEMEVYSAAVIKTASVGSDAVAEDGIPLHHSKSAAFLHSTSPPMVSTANELNRIVGYNQCYLNQSSQFIPLTFQPQMLPINPIPNSFPNISEQLWEWNPVP